MDIDNENRDEDNINDDNQASDSVSEDIHEINERLIDIKNNAIDYIKENPVKAIGVSFAAGIILAQIFRKLK